MSAQWQRKIVGVVLAVGMLTATVWTQQAAGPSPTPGGKGIVGTITFVDAAGFTAKTRDGEVWKVTVGLNTRVTHDGKRAKATDLKVGYDIKAFGQVDASALNTLHAEIAAYQTAEELKALVETFGQSRIAGQVTAVEGTKITISVQLPGQAAPSSKFFEVDQGTVYREAGKQVMLKDVKPGDYVFGVRNVTPGTYIPMPGDYILNRDGVRSGPFVPTLLTIITPDNLQPGAGGPSAPRGPQNPAGPASAGVAAPAGGPPHGGPPSTAADPQR